MLCCFFVAVTIIFGIGKTLLCIAKYPEPNKVNTLVTAKQYRRRRQFVRMDPSIATTSTKPSLLYTHKSVVYHELRSNVVTAETFTAIVMFYDISTLLMSNIIRYRIFRQENNSPIMKLTYLRIPLIRNI